MELPYSVAGNVSHLKEIDAVDEAEEASLDQLHSLSSLLALQGKTCNEQLKRKTS